MGWRNVSFRGFADYMQTPEFAEHLAALIERATRERLALMCAEAVPWRCHRSLIADALVVHGIRAEEIINAARLQEHTLTPFASVDGHDNHLSTGSNLALNGRAWPIPRTLPTSTIIDPPRQGKLSTSEIDGEITTEPAGRSHRDFDHSFNPRRVPHSRHDSLAKISTA